MHTRASEESCFLRSHTLHGFTYLHTRRREIRLESMLPLCRPAVRKNLSVEAGNAIEVITSLITTLHAIRDREFVFHERTASTMHPFSVLSSPTLAFP